MFKVIIRKHLECERENQFFKKINEILSDETNTLTESHIINRRLKACKDHWSNQMCYSALLMKRLAL